jgi:flagellar biosynthesis GTPase FlhF
MSQLDLDSVVFSRLQLTAMENDIKVTKKSTAKSLIAALKKKGIEVNSKGVPVSKASKVRKSRKASKVRKSRKASKVRKSRKASKVRKSRKASKVRKSRKASKVRKSRKASKVRKSRKASKVRKSRKASKVRKSRKASKVRKSRKASKVRKSRKASSFPIETIENAVINGGYCEHPNQQCMNFTISCHGNELWNTLIRIPDNLTVVFYVGSGCTMYYELAPNICCNNWNLCQNWMKWGDRGEPYIYNGLNSFGQKTTGSMIKDMLLTPKHDVYSDLVRCKGDGEGIEIIYKMPSNGVKLSFLLNGLSKWLSDNNISKTGIVHILACRT